MNDRYSRQILFDGIGKDGQERLNHSRVLLVGCGALGASHAEMLARAGVGFLRIVDRDYVEFSNLQRQTLYSESDAEERIPKVIAAKKRLGEINSEIEIDAIIADINHSNIETFVKDVDLVLDGTDNFQIRYLLNDACIKHSKTWIYGAAVSSYGTTMTIIPGKTPCLRCIFEEIPAVGSSPTCDTAGVIQPIISTISSIQVSEAIKLIVGKTEKLHGSLVQVDAWENDWRQIKLSEPNEGCLACDKNEFEFLDAENVDFSTALCGRNAVQVQPANAGQIDLEKLSEDLSKVTTVKQNAYLVRLDIEEYEITVFQDGRGIIRGTDDPTVARSVYAKYIGS